MNAADLIAIDIHTHAEVSCHAPDDDYRIEFEEAKRKYFKSGAPPSIAETIAYYRERKIGLVMFTVDWEFEIGRRRIPNEEVALAAQDNADMMMAFASIDPHKGKMGVRGNASADQRFWYQRIQVSPHLPRVLPKRPHGLSAVRGDC